MNTIQNDQMLKIQHYRYRLNDNAVTFYKKEKGDRVLANIENYNLSNYEWYISRQKIEKLHHLVETSENKKGIIECQIYIPASGQIIKEFSKDKDVVLKSKYKFDDLIIMDRKSLIKICNQFGISYNNRSNDILIKDILRNSGKK